MEKKYKQYESLIEEIVIILGGNTFSFFDRDDIAQQIRSICHNALKYYDNKSSSPKTYLIRCVKNRLNNFKRDNYFRYENVCLQKKCPMYDVFSGSCVIDGFENICEKSINSRNKMIKQKNIKAPLHIGKLREENEDWTNREVIVSDNHIDNVEYKDFISHIRDNIVATSGDSFGVGFDKYIKYGEKYSEQEEVLFYRRVSFEVIKNEF